MNKKNSKFLFEAEEIVVGVSAILLMVAVFLNWGNTPNYSASGLVSSKFFISDGMLVLGMGAIAVILLFVDLFFKIPAWIPAILGTLAFLIGLADFVNLHFALKDLEGNVGIGLYLTLIASLGVIVGSILDLVRNQRK